MLIVWRAPPSPSACFRHGCERVTLCRQSSYMNTISLLGSALWSTRLGCEPRPPPSPTPPPSSPPASVSDMRDLGAKCSHPSTSHFRTSHFPSLSVVGTALLLLSNNIRLISSSIKEEKSKKIHGPNGGSVRPSPKISEWIRDKMGRFRPSIQQRSHSVRRSLSHTRSHNDGRSRLEKRSL